MSDNPNSNLGTFTLLLPNVAGYSPGTATFPIPLLDPDGTAPQLQSSNVAVASTEVNQNADGSYTGTVTAVADGTTTVSILSDGVVDQTATFIVQQEAPQTTNVDPSTIVINPPAPIQAQAAATPAAPAAPTPAAAAAAK